MCDGPVEIKVLHFALDQDPVRACQNIEHYSKGDQQSMNFFKLCICQNTLLFEIEGCFVVGKKVHYLTTMVKGRQ